MNTSLVLASAVAVTPSSSFRRGYCQGRSQVGCCSHWKAQYEQKCQACNKYIREDDCIQNTGGGWQHARCEGDEQRGLESIEASFRQVRPRINDDCNSGARKRLKFEPEDEAEEEAEEEEEEEEEGEEEEEESDEESTFAQYTPEQLAIADYNAEPGDLIHVQALAGCGKTTTIAKLCWSILERQPKARILYLVFGNTAMETARTSGKFPKNTEIRTTHSFVRRNYFGIDNFTKCKPIDQYDLQTDIVQELSLEHDIQTKFPDLEASKRKKIVGTLSRYIRRTLTNFLHSSDTRVTSDHVYWLATEPPIRKSANWRLEFTAGYYVDKAQTLFDVTKEKCEGIRDNEESHSIPHDAYLKVAQLEGLNMSSYGYIAIDEAQDMTACQGNLFWGEGNLFKSCMAIYLVGDACQQLYRFRGASSSFSQAANESTEQFSLTGSFRFGPPIAATATAVLQLLDPDVTLEGLCGEPCRVVKQASAFESGVVLCRTNRGIFDYLLYNNPPQWCFLQETRKLPQVTELHIKIEKFIWRETETLRYKDELFQSEGDIEDYLEDADDYEFRMAYMLIKTLCAGEKRMAEFVKEITESFDPLDGRTPEEYEGVVLSTVHGAKGLEFDSVFIHRDFSFERLTELKDQLAYSRITDEVNMIYVSVTRTKKNLFLSRPAFEFLSSVGAFEHFACGEPCPVDESDASWSKKSQEEERRAWNEEWLAFVGVENPVMSVNDVPWPKGPSENPFWLDGHMTEKHQKDFVYKLIRRFHTDKFRQTFRARLQSINKVDWEALKEKLDEYASKATELLRMLRTLENGEPL